MSLDYDSLIQIVQDEAVDIDSTFITGNIAQIIERAQLRIQRDIDIDATRKETTVGFSGSTLTLPSDLILLQAIRMEDGEYLLPKERTYLRDYWPDPSLTGTPKYYAWVDDQTLLVAPSAAGGTNVELAYTFRIPLLNSSSQTTNWFTDVVPDLLQAAMLYEAAVWTKDAQLEALYDKRYRQTLDAVVFEQNLRKRTDEYRKGIPRAIKPQSGGAA